MKILTDTYAYDHFEGKHGHMCRGKKYRPYPSILCSLCRGKESGSFEVIGKIEIDKGTNE